jgi:hypothetical protein
MSEPVVYHHGREVGGAGSDEARPSASTACWAALATVGLTLTLACVVGGPPQGASWAALATGIASRWTGATAGGHPGMWLRGTLAVVASIALDTKTARKSIHIAVHNSVAVKVSGRRKRTASMRFVSSK